MGMEAICDLATSPAAAAGNAGRGGFRARAGWFGPDDRPRFGWLYRPHQSAGLAGMVIVPPFGHDEICAHRTLRHLAEASARSGFITLRFDLDGCGDSAGDDSDPDRVESWITSVQDACDLVRGAGAAQLVLVGLRLGATLAAFAAQRRDDVAALVAFNPVVRGKPWLRELRAFQAAMNLQPSPVPTETDGQEAGGFLLGAETCGALKAIDLTRNTAPAPRVLILDRDDLPGADTWREHLQACGCHVAQRRIAGYAELMDDPHRSRVAQAFIDACIEYTRDVPAFAGTRLEKPAPSLRPSTTQHVSDGEIVETVVSPGAGIFGILAEPAHCKADRALIMLNAGAVRHVGVCRFDVGFSRQLAASGLRVLRVDLTGIGDSPAREGAAENMVYGPHDIEDVGVCVNWLRMRNVRELAVGGVCAGASHALRAAMAGQPIDTVYLVNCAVFAPKVGLDPGVDRRFNDIAHYNKSVKSVRSWRKLLSGNVDLRRIARVAAWKIVLRGKRLVWEAARRAGMPMPHDLSRGFAALARRGVNLHFLYSGNDPGRVRLAVEAGSSVPEHCRAGRFSMQVFDGANHTFTQRWAQDSLRQALWQILLPNSGNAPVSVSTGNPRTPQTSAGLHHVG